MRNMRNAWVALAVTGVLAFGSALRAEPEQLPWTAISVPDLDCAGCAKRVEGQLKKVAHVERVQTDMKTKTCFALPQTGMVLSPRAVWEAVEKAGKKPVQLQGPSGTFTEKPEN